MDLLLELAAATAKVAAHKDGAALIDIQLDIWEAKQRQLDNSNFGATIKGDSNESVGCGAEIAQ